MIPEVAQIVSPIWEMLSDHAETRHEGAEMISEVWGIVSQY
jgi:hypothetical protein